ncbi:phosphatidate cytidylyltransferase [Flavobacterium sp. CBA20B-1]|uniref:Phosphatidate cytidylyltransferase n=1 Tax=Paenimyroides aestuarii TaxID=2968490 RepID=A0ABY5NPB2_9FLAO|nr:MULTISPECIES: phosphatidate cytidylyltransferase [Flavobacteriaceae]UUV20392.1 phosphatidate cytidylyltransferase [Paenimyroides aestuarii]WCM41835.1 phosphatidate cytidylyltransferase [Flavobacterium sp. CBA20B-1]
MKKYFLFGSIGFMCLLLTSCEAVETIFKAGMWWAFFLVFLVIGIILWIFSKMRGRK